MNPKATGITRKALLLKQEKQELMTLAKCQIKNWLIPIIST